MAQVSIFVSHSHQDNEWCRPLVTALKAVGYDVWYDEIGLTGGDAWVATIQREVQARDVFLPMLTPEAWVSEWVQKELQLAVATKRRILPVLLRNTQVDGFLLTTQWVTVIGEKPPVAARSIVMAIEAPTAPGRNAAPQVQTETLDDLITLCRSLIAEKRYTEALSTSSRGLAIDPDSIEMLRLRGWVLLQINEPDKAAETWGRMLSLASSERVKDMGNEVVEWLLDVQPFPDSLVHGVYTYRPDMIGHLPPLISQLASGDVVYSVFENFLECRAGVNWEQAQLRTLVSAVRDDSILADALANYKDHYSWDPGTSLWSKARNMAVPDRAILVGLLCERRFGYPPSKATAADVDGLRYYRRTLDVLARFPYLADPEKGPMVDEYMQRLSR